MTNLEVSVALLLLGACRKTSSLNEPDLPQGMEGDDEKEAAQLLRCVRKAVVRLRAMGYTDAELLAEESSAPECIHISRDYRITLPSRGDEELRLPPLQKTVFILFLRHPEGLEFKHLNAFSKELLQIYETICPGVEKDVRERRIERLVCPIDSSIHMTRSKLSRALERYFPQPSAQAYEIIGANGRRKVIPLDRTLVIWE